MSLQPTVEGESRYLLATFEGGDYPLWEWLATADAANQPGLSALVAGGRYELYSNYPLQIQAVAASIIANA
jgi:hypothetical protein